MSKSTVFSYPKQDIVAGTVVFLIALPLCLGIAIACGLPPLSGLIAGIVGGLIVPLISRSPLSVTGPAAGLTSIVLMEVERLGGVNPFLAAVVAAGFLQITLGVLKTGRFSALVPAAMIKGMLASIGITIVLKQLPVAAGASGKITDIFSNFHAGALGITAISLVMLYGWKHTPLARFKFFPPALGVVVVCSVVSAALDDTSYALSPELFVAVPLGGLSSLIPALPRPDWNVLATSGGWIAALTIAIVASIETLLSVQAVDRLDPLKRRSPPDRELVAQGAANAVSGFLGGLPVTAVIVRSGANVAAGGRERLSAIVHSVLLVISVVFLAQLLNHIPLACLAAILIQVGLNLAKPSLFTEQFKQGLNQFLPFAITIAAVLATDLLKGVIIGLVSGIIFVLRQNIVGALETTRSADGAILIRFTRDITFLSKPLLMTELENLEDGVKLTIDGTGEFIDQDVKESLATFLEDAHSRNIEVTLKGIDLKGVSAGGGH